MKIKYTLTSFLCLMGKLSCGQKRIPFKEDTRQVPVINFPAHLQDEAALASGLKTADGWKVRPVAAEPQGLFPASNGTGAKLLISNPNNGTEMKKKQFFQYADAKFVSEKTTLTAVQNSGVKKNLKIKAPITGLRPRQPEAARAADRSVFPSTPVISGSQTCIMNTGFTDLAEGHNVPSKKFPLQRLYLILKKIRSVKSIKYSK